MSGVLRRTAGMHGEWRGTGRGMHSVRRQYDRREWSGPRRQRTCPQTAYTPGNTPPVSTLTTYVNSTSCVGSVGMRAT
jgi:hypothetical protein